MPTPSSPSSSDNNGKIEKTKSLSELEIRSEEVQEIIGNPPHWIVRWGITSFFAVLAIILLSASIIKYPEVINAPLKLTAINAPKTVQTKISGKLIRLFPENNSTVKEGEILGWMESMASHQSVLDLDAKIDSLSQWLQNNEWERIKSLQRNFNDLGELQSNYQIFEEAYRRFLLYLPEGYYSKRKEVLLDELNLIDDLLIELDEQKSIREASFKLAEKEFNVQKQLAEKGVIASLELIRAENNFQNQRLPLQQVESSIINNQISRTAKNKEIMDLDQQINEQVSIFKQALNTFRSTIVEWKLNYLLTAPTDGTLLYTGILQEKQHLNAGQNIFYIQPDNVEFFGEMIISQSSFGKIEEGQQVLIKFNGYPYSEYGSVTGKVEYLSLLPVKDSLFFAKVAFPSQLNTNYGHALPPVNGMTGQAEIITHDMRLLERIYNNLTKELR